jgi:hypothetical protein
MRKIVIIGTKNQFGMSTLFHMETPKLKEISLIKCWLWDSMSIPALMKRSGCYLEVLLLQECRVRPPELIELLSAIPTLRKLVLSDNIPNTVTDAVLHALTLSGVPGILPTLNTLILRGNYLFSIGKLLTMLEGRMGSQPPLMNIHVALPSRQVTKPELEKFAALAEVYPSPLGIIMSAGSLSNWQYTNQSEL